MMYQKLIACVLLAILLVLPVNAALYLKTENGMITDNRPDDTYVIDNRSTYDSGGFPAWKNINTVYGLPINVTTSDLLWRPYIYTTCSGNTTGNLTGWGGYYTYDTLAINSDHGSYGYLGVRPNCTASTYGNPYFNIIEWKGYYGQFTIVGSWNIYDYLTVPSPTGDLTVNVKDVVSHNAINGAFVEYAYAPGGMISGYTDTNGNITFTTIPTNLTTRDLTVAMSGYTTKYDNAILSGATAFKQVWMGAEGYTRTYVQNVDGTSGGQVHGSNVYIKSVLNNTWMNWTSDDDGTGYIDTLPTDTIDAYGTATGYSSASRLGLTPGDFVYELILWPGAKLPTPGSGLPGDPGVNNVNLIIIVNDKTTSQPIEGATTSVTVPTGSTQGKLTNSAGTAMYAVPNMSVILVTASKTGYIHASKSTTTTQWGPDTVRIELNKIVVTPTVTATPLPGELTVRPTIDIRTDAEKDSDMMGILRDNGEILINLAILVTIVSLFGLMRKGM